MGAGAVGLTAGRAAPATVGSLLVMGAGGGLVLATIQATLADHHGERRAVALTEANVAASVAYVALIGALSLAAAAHAGWRLALLASLAVPVLAWAGNRRLAIDAPNLSRVVAGSLSSVFWIAAAMLFCTTAAEWCIAAWGATFVEDAAWGATFVEDAAGVSTDTAVADGRLLRRRAGRARARQPARAPPRSGAAARAGAGRDGRRMSFAVLLAPLVVGALADATSLTTALAVVPMLALAAAGLALVRRRTRPRAAITAS